MTATFTLTRGTAPLLISMPHTGTFLPREIAARLTQAALRLPDTDWHMERLYDFASTLGASVIAATHSRYAIDLNRPPDNASLYPGQDITGLCPVDTFHREPLYLVGQQPGPAEIQRRVEQYWRPYHAALRTELDRLRALHGRVVLWDAHSICSVLPRFFEGCLTDLNVGTADGSSCDHGLAQRVMEIARSHPGYTAVLNGRFKGGYITRHYGRPSQGVHAIQLELAQLVYMHEEHPYPFEERRAAALRPLLIEMLRAVLRP
jgi:N-formylglutamate deformylase